MLVPVRRAASLLLLFLAAATIVSACRSKNDDAPIEIPLPSGADTPDAPSPSSAQPGATAGRSADPKRAAPSSTSTGDAPDPAKSGLPATKPKPSGRAISTQL